MLDSFDVTGVSQSINVTSVSVSRPPDPERRDALLAAATEHVLAHGMADLSLRPLAQALSTSPRMLLYHFGSKGQLIAEILAAARLRQAELTAGWLAEQPHLGPAELLRRFWRWQTDQHRPFLRLFFEVYGLALQRPNRFPGLPRDAVRDWLPLIERTLEEAGVPGPQAGSAASIVIAGYRGLLMDVLATDDLERTTEALDLFLDAIEQHLTPGG
jgi:AcrR family transcriptional regulator